MSDTDKKKEKKYDTIPDDKTVARDLFYLKPLLNGLNTNEKEIDMKNLKDKMKNHSFRGCILIFSDMEIHRHASIIALSKEFNRNNTYVLEVMDNILNSWFVNIASEIGQHKRDMINCDVLIIHGSKITNEKSMLRSLTEIVSIRKSQNKATWIFIETDSTIIRQMVKEELEDIVNKTYNYQLK